MVIWEGGGGLKLLFSFSLNVFLISSHFCSVLKFPDHSFLTDINVLVIVIMRFLHNIILNMPKTRIVMTETE